MFRIRVAFNSQLSAISKYKEVTIKGVKGLRNNRTCATKTNRTKTNRIVQVRRRDEYAGRHMEEGGIEP